MKIQPLSALFGAASLGVVLLTVSAFQAPAGKLPAHQFSTRGNSGSSRAPSGQAQANEASPDSSAAEEVACAFFEASRRGEWETLISLSGLPFAWDRKDVIVTASDLRRRFESVFASAEPREAGGYSSKVMGEVVRIEGDCVPMACVAVEIKLGSETVLIAVSSGDYHRIIGFSD